MFQIDSLADTADYILCSVSCEDLYLQCKCVKFPGLYFPEPVFFVATVLVKAASLYTSAGIPSFLSRLSSRARLRNGHLQVIPTLEGTGQAGSELAVGEFGRRALETQWTIC